MAKKRKKRKGKKEGGIDKCFGKWDVDIARIAKDFRRDFPTAYHDLLKWRDRLKADLNSDPNAIFRLLRNPVIYEVNGIKRRRVRLSTKDAWVRLIFVVNITKCEVIVINYDKRGEHTYKAFRRQRK